MQLMKQLIILVLVLITCYFSQGQIVPFETMPGVKTIEVIQDCERCNPPIKSKKVAQLFFDKNGNNTEWYSMNGDTPIGKQEFNYKNEILISCINRNAWVSTSNEGDFGMVWDSTFLVTQEFYYYTHERLSKIQRLDGETKRIEFFTNFIYNADGKLVEEITTCYPDPDFAGSFEPGTDKLISIPEANKIITLRKVFQYKENFITIQYFKDSIPTGIETIEENGKGNKIISVVKDMKGQIRSQINYKYNENGQMVEKISTNKGYNAFGNISDELIFDKEIKIYDLKGNLISKTDYLNGLVYIEERYEYIY